jgi:hypothetical protein
MKIVEGPISANVIELVQQGVVGKGWLIEASSKRGEVVHHQSFIAQLVA